MQARSLLTAVLLSILVTAAQAEDEAKIEITSFEQAAQFVKTYCFECHTGDEPEADLNLARYEAASALTDDVATWTKIMRRVRDGEMPPEDSRAPTAAERTAFARWIEAVVQKAACGDGISPAPAPVRRLNRSQYTATMRDLLGITFDAGAELPNDGAGGEGFDNAAETLFLSPVHAEKYLEAAERALTYVGTDYVPPEENETLGGGNRRGRRRPPRTNVFFVQPSDQVSPQDAARQILERFLTRAFRRPLREGQVNEYLALCETARKRGDPFEESVLYAMRAALVSPYFLFRIEEPNEAPAPRPVNDYELATRLSYFLWNSMPDEALFKLAASGKLHDDDELARQVQRMLADERTTQFAQNFVEQWLGTRALGTEIRPDSTRRVRVDDELIAELKQEPVLFFREILAEDLSLVNVIDSDFVFINNQLGRMYGVRGARNQAVARVDLTVEDRTRRGGVLGMGAVLAVSSYPHRTSPVLRGKWVLETLLGTPPPPPPPDVPELDEQQIAKSPGTLREVLEQHRENRTCAACHNRIDPLGFGLENYDVLGRWRTEEAGQPIDNRGELPDGSKFEGPEGLKQLLLARKDQVVAHLTRKMLGYALGRGLTPEDDCVVHDIVEKLQKNDYRAQTLILEIVRSVPFRYQPGTDPKAPAKVEGQPTLAPDSEEGSP